MHPSFHRCSPSLFSPASDAPLPPVLNATALPPPVPDAVHQAPIARFDVLINAEKHGEGHKEVDGVEEGAHAVHVAAVHKCVVGKLQGNRLV